MNHAPRVRQNATAEAAINNVTDRDFKLLWVEFITLIVNGR